MLLEAYPASIVEKTHDGKSALAIAKATATKSHPNYALIKALEEELQSYGGSSLVEAANVVPERVSSNDTFDSVPQRRPQRKKKARKARTSNTPTTTKRIKKEGATRGVAGLETPAAADLLLNFARTNVVPNVVLDVVPKLEPEDDTKPHGPTQVAEMHHVLPHVVPKLEPELDIKPHTIMQVAEV